MTSAIYKILSVNKSPNFSLHNCRSEKKIDNKLSLLRVFIKIQWKVEIFLLYHLIYQY